MNSAAKTLERTLPIIMAMNLITAICRLFGQIAGMAITEHRFGMVKATNISMTISAQTNAQSRMQKKLCHGGLDSHVRRL